MKLAELWYRKIVTPIIGLLKQGITPEKIVLSICFGIVLGVIPVLGSTTILCTLAALIFRLNLPAIHIINYLVYPLQIIFLIPFYRAGAWLFDADVLLLSAGKVIAMINEDTMAAIRFLWDTTAHALVVWLILAPVVGILLYLILLPLVRQLPLEPSATPKMADNNN
jgi:uncharacterized protein (DUF2062 family)